MGKKSREKWERRRQLEQMGNQPQQNRGVLLHQQQQIVKTGPLPSAEEFEKYNQVLPGAADRIVRMAEQQQTHRHALEVRTTRAAIIEARLGQIFAFVVAMTGLVGGVYLTATDHKWEGIGAMLAGLGLIVAAFLGRRRGEKGEKH